MPGRGGPSQPENDVFHHLDVATQPLVVTGPGGQIREPRSQMGMGVAGRKRASEVYPNSACITPRVISSASDSLGAIPTGPLGRPPRIRDQQVINRHVQ